MKSTLFSLALILFLFTLSAPPSLADSITIDVKFPSEVKLNQEATVDFKILGSTDKHRVKVYGSPDKNNRHSRFVYTFNGKEFINQNWDAFPLYQGGEESQITFKVQQMPDEGDILFIKLGIEGDANVSEWQEVRVVDSENSNNQTQPTEDNANDTDQTTPQATAKWPDEVEWGNPSTVEVEVKNTNKEYYVKVMGSLDQSKYGYVRTIYNNKNLAWNSSWSNFPVIKGGGKKKVEFFTDADSNEIYVLVRIREKDGNAYYDTLWQKLSVKKPPVESKDNDDKNENEKDENDLNNNIDNYDEGEILGEDIESVRLDSRFNYGMVAVSLRENDINEATDETDNNSGLLSEREREQYNNDKKPLREDKFFIFMLISDLWNLVVNLLGTQSG